MKNLFGAKTRTVAMTLGLLAAAGCDSTITGGGDHLALGDSAADGSGTGGPKQGNMTPLGPMVTLQFDASDEDLVNPERGYYAGLNLLSGDPARIRAKGNSIAIALVRLDDYRDRSLDSALLDGLSQGFARVRAAGVKVVLRFMYNSSFSADASRDRIIGHVNQLKPLLQANADVIAVMQAGLIGAWGEWHGSTNGLDNAADRGAILHALLDALPASRAVQIRTPMYKEGILSGGPLTEEEGFSGSDRARVGHHNDCFLASETDLGTYASPVPNWESYVAEDGRFTPIGGETCSVYTPKTNCETAVAEMETSHWSYLNSEYKQEVLAGWDAEGCGTEVERRLGYRFAFSRATHSEAVAPGGLLDLEVEVQNLGFASPFNARPVYVVLSQGDKRFTARLEAVDPRRWEAGQTTTIGTRLRVPADLAPGKYSLAMWLPDADSALRDDPRYAIRLANEGAWTAAGDNVLTQELAIDPAAPGEVDASATEFAEVR
jgi:hypothetical protein